jgi:hypothetical protein
MYIEETGFYTFKKCHKTESLQNHTATAHKERERLGDRRNVGESSCNCGDGPGQMAQPLMFMMMMRKHISYLLPFNGMPCTAVWNKDVDTRKALIILFRVKVVVQDDQNSLCT